MAQYKLTDAKAVSVTKDNRPVVKIVAIRPPKRTPGSGKGIWMVPDFDDPINDFAEYM